MTIAGAGAVTARPDAPGPAGRMEDPAKIRDAAQQFEALLIGELLKSMHEAASGGWLGTGDDQAGAGMVEIAQEHFAATIAKQGGLGLANLVVQGLGAQKP